MRLARQKFIFVITGVSLAGSITPLRAAEDATLDKLFETGKALFDQYAPDEIKEQYDFPTKAQWDEFAARLQTALQSDNVAELLPYEDEAKSALTALRVLPGYEDYADWLQERIDYIEAAKELSTTPPEPPTPKPKPKPDSPAPTTLATSAMSPRSPSRLTKPSR